MRGHRGAVTCVSFFDRDSCVAAGDERGKVVLHRVADAPSDDEVGLVLLGFLFPPPQMRSRIKTLLSCLSVAPHLGSEVQATIFLSIEHPILDAASAVVLVCMYVWFSSPASRPR